MARNRGENHKLLKKPKVPQPPRSPRHDVEKPRKKLPRPHRLKARGS